MTWKRTGSPMSRCSTRAQVWFAILLDACDRVRVCNKQRAMLFAHHRAKTTLMANFV